MQRPHDTLEFTHEDLREAEERQFHKDITRAVQTQKITAEQGYRAVRKAGYTTTSYFGQDMGLSPKGSNVGGIPGFLGVDKEGHAHYETFGDWMRALGKTLAGEPLSDPNSASNLTDEERDYLGLEKNDTVLGPDRHDLSDREASKRGGQTGNDSPGGGGTVGGYDPGGYGDQSDGGGEFRGTGGYGGGGVGHSSEGDPAGFNPIVLDLDGDGFVELVDIDASTAFFDINGDGYRTHLGWAAADDGFLVYDKEEAGEDGFGVIRDADELSFVSYIDGAETDLEGLAHFDTNGDGRLNSGDDEWDKFRVWQDLDQDGETDDGELLTLGEWGIESVDLTSDGIEQDLGGNKVFGIGSYTLSEAAGGETRYLADVSLATSQIGFRTSADGSFEVQASDGSNIYEDSRFSNLDIDLGKLGYLGAFGFDGADRITSGQTGETLLDGGEGDDTLTGGGGNDWILGGAGADVLDGGEGHDILLIDADDLVAGSVLGGAGFDIAFVEGDAAVTLDVKAAGLEAVLGGGAADQLTSTYIAEDETDDLDIDVYLDGDDGSDTLTGGAGDDLLIGGEGNDTLDGGAGRDAVEYGGDFADYDVVYDAAKNLFTVTDKVGTDGVDTLMGVGEIRFADQTLVLDDLLKASKSIAKLDAGETVTGTLSVAGGKPMTPVLSASATRSRTATARRWVWST